MGAADSGDPGVPPALRTAVKAASDPDGFVPFDRFMDAALYTEGVGYYTRTESPLGASGDFYTAPEVHPLFAATFAERVVAARAGLPASRALALVELGPGDGRFMEALLTALGPRADAMSVVLVERSHSLRDRALERVRRAADPLGVPVHTRDGVGALGPFEGVVLANELLDAQPVRRLLRRGNGWVELGIRVEGDRFVPAESPAMRPVGGSPLPTSAPEGTVVEIAPTAEALVREVADHLTRGLLLVDDYGMEESELVAAHPNGTLDGIRGHRSGFDPLESPGRTDLSTFVNFTRIRAAAHAAGLVLLSERRQAEALGAWGFPRLLDEALRSAGGSEAEVRLRLAAKNLLFGFERFRILEFAPRPPGPSAAV